MSNNYKNHRNFWKIFSGVVGILLCVICIPVLLLNFTMIIKGLTKPDEIPSVFNFCPIIEGSNLMESPATRIKNGDLLFFKTGDAEYKLGETDGTVVAIITDTDSVMVRRLIGSRTGEDGQELYIADAENRDENTRVEFTADDIIGVYVGRMAGMGKVVLFSHRPIGTFLMVILPLVLLFVAEFFIIKHDMAQANSEESTSPAPVYHNPFATYLEGGKETIIAEYDAYFDNNGKQVVELVKKNKKAAKHK